MKLKNRDIKNEKDIKRIVNQNFFKETIEEFNRFSPTYSEFALNIGIKKYHG